VESLQEFNLDPNPVNTMSLAANQHFVNDDPGTIKRRYAAEKKVEQTASF